MNFYPLNYWSQIVTGVCLLIPEVAKKIFKNFFWTPGGAVSRVWSRFSTINIWRHAADKDFIGLNESSLGALTLIKNLKFATLRKKSYGLPNRRRYPKK